MCRDCIAHLPFLKAPLCPRCGQPQASGILCPECAATQSRISSIRSIFRFEGIVRRAVHELKYHNLRAIAPTLAAYLIAFVSETGMTCDAIVPVPLHSRRTRERGYNQAELLAGEIERGTGFPMLNSALRRTRAGASQARTASAADRTRNVSGAFTCTDVSVSGKRILLIDDVCTTGATLESCAGALCAGGASNVVGLTVAREV